MKTLKIKVENNTRFTLKKLLDHKDYKTLTSFINPSAITEFMIDGISVQVITYSNKNKSVFTELKY